MSSITSFIAIPRAPRNIQIAIKPANVHISQAAKDIIISVIFHSGSKHSGPIVNPFIKSQKVGVEPTLIVLETTVLP